VPNSHLIGGYFYVGPLHQDAKLLTMNTATISEALKTPRAVLACLAWALLLACAQGQEDLRPLRDAATQSNSSEPILGGTATVTDEYFEDDESPEPVNPPPPSVTGGTSSTGWPTVGSAAQPSFQRRVWRWVPRGMVPFGPRTPDSEKDLGIGLPLVGNGWRKQPFSITAFSGVTDGGALIPGHLNQQPSYYGGLNLGWDYDHHWGFEKRLGFGALNLTNGAHQPIPTTGLSVTGEYRLMYYPLGDARWRPFLTAGVGWSDFYFQDDRGAKHLDTVGNIPFGAGMKYLWSERLALRIDLIDEMTFGGGVLSNFHYAALTVGLEVRYGKRLINMPWHRKDGS
jgi:hypothetical protein